MFLKGEPGEITIDILKRENTTSTELAANYAAATGLLTPSI